MSIKPWSYEEEQIIERMWAEGKRTREIAKILGHPRNSKSVQSKANRMGLKQRREIPDRREQQPLLNPPNREPCPRCGIPGFRGCEHREAFDPPPRLSSRVFV